MEFPQTDLSSGWGGRGTEGGPHASFFKRYYLPLSQYARLKFGVDAALAEELAARYFSRQWERDRGEGAAIFRLYDAGKGRFRSFLATAFWRFCRDELEKESRRRGRALDSVPEELLSRDHFEFGRLVAREMFNALRAEIQSMSDEGERAFLELKWPRDLLSSPLPEAEIGRRLGLPRGQVRGLNRRIADRFTYLLHKQAAAAGLNEDEARTLLGDCCRALDHEERAVEEGGRA